ncbi:MAG: glutaredoxin-like protein NrdH [Microbacteriaceae bacterium]|nr:glutaredoxin-like protein NrdH [Microbacteriaceae bacterium]
MSAITESPATSLEAVVYSKPSCVQCAATYRALDAKGVRYRVVDLAQDPEALAYVKGLGYSSAPVVVVSDTDHWAGFRPDHIERIAAQLEAARS